MNIKFKSIEIHNFLSLGDVEVNFEEQGFVLVRGENTEGSIQCSNGSGKSSIFDSVLWTVCGETTRGATSVKNDKTEDGVYCTLKFSIDDVEYTIIRSRDSKKYGKSLLFYKEDELLSDQIKKSQELIYTTIPVVNPQILGSIVLLGQGLPYKFTGLSPAKRKELLETLSGSTENIQALKEQIELKEYTYKQEIGKIELEISKLLGEVSGLESSVESLKINKKSSTALSDDEIDLQIKTIKEEITSIDKQLDELKEKQTKVFEGVQKVEASRDMLSKTLILKQQEIKTIKDKLNSIKSGVCPTCNRPYDVTEDMINEKDTLSKELDKSSEELTLLQEKHSHINQRCLDGNKMSETIKSEMDALNYKRVSHSSKIESLESKKGISIDFDKQINELEDDIKFKKIQSTELSDKKLKLEEIYDCIQFLKREISRDFKGYLLTDVIDYVSDRAAHYSEYLFQGKKVTVTSSGNKIIIALDGREYENLSGGERQRVDLSVQFALRDMLVTTTGFSCNILTLDEAFDNLDAVGSNALIELVVSELNDIESIYIVTHHSDIAVPYDKQIIVKKGVDGVSTIE